MAGALAGAYLFRFYGFYAFFFPVAILCYTLLYDIFRIRVKRYYRRLQNPFKTQ